MKRRNPQPLYVFVLLLALVLACNAPFGLPAPAPASQVGAATPQSSATAGASNPAAVDTPTTPPITHVAMPVDSKISGPLSYDVDSSGTAPQHRAPYGDSYNINLLERPFTQQDMTYVPSLDISTFQLTSDGTWYVVFIGLIGHNANDPVNIDYGVEIDKDHDGFGDVLVWAQPPYGTQWTTEGVKVFTDPNHDTGGASPEKSDVNATTGAPLAGDGYETMIFNQGQGDDPDLAWVRIDPTNPAFVEFAFKNSLAGPSFMWGAWADAGLKNPAMFNYNDRFSLAQAGSPIGGNANYAIKALYAVDNTCRAAYGFKPSGLEPGLCPTSAPPAGKAPASCNLSYAICISKGYGDFNAGTCTCIVAP